MTESIIASDATIRISSVTDTSMAGGCIAHQLREHGSATVQAIGAKAVNQAVKALTVADSMLASSSMALFYRSKFIDLTIDNRRSTAIRFRVMAIKVKEATK